MDFYHLLKSAGLAVLVVSALLALLALSLVIHSVFGIVGFAVLAAVLLFAWTTFCFYRL